MTATAGATLLVHLIVPGEPVPKARPRVARGHAYTPHRTVEAEARVLEYLWYQYPRLQPQTGRFSVSLTFYLKGVGRGDWDNYSKLACDALNKRVWVDDRMVRQANVEMVEHSALPRTEITVHLLHEAQAA